MDSVSKLNSLDLEEHDYYEESRSTQHGGHRHKNHNG
jgi:hypothetical protein